MLPGCYSGQWPGHFLVYWALWPWLGCFVGLWAANSALTLIGHSATARSPQLLNEINGNRSCTATVLPFPWSPVIVETVSSLPTSSPLFSWGYWLLPAVIMVAGLQAFHFSLPMFHEVSWGYVTWLQACRLFISLSLCFLQTFDFSFPMFSCSVYFQIMVATTTDEMAMTTAM
jgi:hypothetical protein